MVHVLSDRLSTQPINQRALRKSATSIRLVSILLAVYWGLVLPFICWGAWATPGHPHSSPHFVFFEPLHAAVQSAPITTAQLASLVSRLGSLCSRSVSEPPNAQTTGLATHQHNLTGAQQTAPPITEPASAGQSTPTLAIMLLVILIPLAAMTFLGWRRHVVSIVQMIFSSDVALPIPTPPPRVFITTPAGCWIQINNQTSMPHIRAS